MTFSSKQLARIEWMRFRFHGQNAAWAQQPGPSVRQSVSRQSVNPSVHLSFAHRPQCWNPGCYWIHIRNIQWSFHPAVSFQISINTQSRGFSKSNHLLCWPTKTKGSWWYLYDSWEGLKASRCIVHSARRRGSHITHLGPFAGFRNLQSNKSPYLRVHGHIYLPNSPYLMYSITQCIAVSHKRWTSQEHW